MIIKLLPTIFFILYTKHLIGTLGYFFRFSESISLILIDKTIVILFVILCFIYIIKKNIKPDLFSLYVAVISCCAILIGAYFYTINYFYLAQLFTPFLIIGSFLVAKRCNLTKEEINKKLYLYSNIIFYTSFIIMPLNFLLFFQGTIGYLGLSSTILIIPLIIFYYQKKYFKTFLSFIFIILSGKRAVILGVIFCIVIIFSRYIKSFKLKISVKKIILIILTPMLILFITTKLNINEKLFNRTLFIFENIENIVNEKTLFIITSGRSSEYYNTIKILNDNPIHYIFGTGYGFNYDNIHIFNDNVIKKNHFVHISPLNFLIFHGFILGSLFLIMVFKKLFIKTKTGSIHHQIQIITIGLFFVGLTSYSWCTSFYEWFFLGLVSNKKLE